MNKKKIFIRKSILSDDDRSILHDAPRSSRRVSTSRRVRRVLPTISGQRSTSRVDLTVEIDGVRGIHSWQIFAHAAPRDAVISKVGPVRRGRVHVTVAPAAAAEDEDLRLGQVRGAAYSHRQKNRGTGLRERPRISVDGLAVRQTRRDISVRRFCRRDRPLHVQPVLEHRASGLEERWPVQRARRTSMDIVENEISRWYKLFLAARINCSLKICFVLCILRIYKVKFWILCTGWCWI